MLLGSGFFFIPGIGPVMAGGPVVGWIVSALEAAVVTGGITALGGALVSVGIPRDSVIRYEAALKSSKFLLLIHGTEAEAESARQILQQNQAEEASMHQEMLEQHGDRKDHQLDSLLEKLRSF